MRAVLAAARGCLGDLEGGVPIAAAVYAPDGAHLACAVNGRGAGEHAELRALQLGCTVLRAQRLDGCTLYVSAEPCLMCLGAALLFRCRRLVYGCSSEKFGALSTRAVDPAVHVGVHAMEMCGGVYADEAAALLSAFFRAKRRGGAAEQGAAMPLSALNGELIIPRF